MLRGNNARNILGILALVITVLLVILMFQLINPGTNNSDNEIEAFATDVITETFSGQYGPLYDRLHPMQQDMFTRSQFIQCATERAQSAIITDHMPEFDFIETYQEDVQIPGTVLEVPSTAVTVEFDFGGQSRRQTMHFVLEDDHWAWMLTTPEECEDSES